MFTIVSSVLLLIVFAMGNLSDNYELKNVLVLSRHNIRTPLTEDLGRYSPKQWPEWHGKPGDLTPKGFLMETFMGRYFSEWFKSKGLFIENCPESKDVHIYANTKQRTKMTAKAFVNGAFGECKVDIKFKDGIEMDPVFNPVVTDTSQEFKDEIIKDMTDKLKEVQLDDAYSKLEELVGIKDSKTCKVDYICDLHGENKIVFEVGNEPNLDGPLSVGSSLVDAYLMAYYDGFDLKEIQNEEVLKLLIQINIQNHNVRFNSSVIAKYTSLLLVDYMKGIFLQETPPKLTLLVGHDSNIIPVLRALDVEHYVLPEQKEITPIGGKLVFQKWLDKNNNKELLKIDYVYPSTKQIRKGEELSMKNPPKITHLHLKHCKKDENGICLWSHFVELLKKHGV